MEEEQQLELMQEREKAVRQLEVHIAWAHVVLKKPWWIQYRNVSSFWEQYSSL